MLNRIRELHEGSESVKGIDLEGIKFPEWDPFVGLNVKEHDQSHLHINDDLVRRLSDSKQYYFSTIRQTILFMANRENLLPQGAFDVFSITSDGYIVAGTDTLIGVKWLQDRSGPENDICKRLSCKKLKQTLDELGVRDILLLNRDDINRERRHSLHSPVNLAFTLNWFSNNQHPENEPLPSKAELSSYLGKSESSVNQMITSYEWSEKFHNLNRTGIGNVMPVFTALHRKRKAFREAGFDPKSPSKLDEIMTLFAHLLSDKGKDLLVSRELNPTEITQIVRKMNLASFRGSYGDNHDIIEAYIAAKDSTTIAQLVPDAFRMLDRVISDDPDQDIHESDKYQLIQILEDIIEKIRSR